MKSKKLIAVIIPAVLLTLGFVKPAKAETKSIVNVYTSNSGNYINGKKVANNQGTSKTSVDVNGTHIESNESGEIRVESSNGETKVTTTPGMKVDITKGEAKVEEEKENGEERKSTSSANESEESSKSAHFKSTPKSKLGHQKFEFKQLLKNFEFSLKSFFKLFHFS